MALTESTMTELGAPAPDFRVPDVVTGKTVARDDFRDRKAMLVMFLSRHCPYVQHVKNGLANLVRDYSSQSVGIIAISSNYVPDNPADSPQGLKEMAAELEWDAPFCYDESQDVAKSYQAACTPDFFLYDENRRLVYRGQMDGARKGNDVPVTGSDLRSAIDAVLAGRPVATEQRPSLGCNIKWRQGNEPGYYR